MKNKDTIMILNNLNMVEIRRPIMTYILNYKLLEQTRKNLDMSVEELKNKSGVPLQTIKNILTGKTTNSRMDTILPITEALGIDIKKAYTDEFGNPITKEEVLTEMVNDVIETKNVTDISVIALKEIYEHQLTQMKEFYAEQHNSTCKYYEKRLEDQERYFNSRLADKDEHNNTLMLDKKWFRLASVFSVASIVALFFFIEFASPGHGWFRSENGYDTFPYVIGLISVVEFVVIVWFLTRKNKRQDT